jgi:hypothetical protein
MSVPYSKQQPAPEPNTNNARAANTTDPILTLDQFTAIPRIALEPYIATPDGRSVLLARSSLLLIAGPSGVGKSLIGAWDLGGRLAADQPSLWLGLRIRGGLRVLLLSYEGSDEDTDDRTPIVPASAHERFLLWDRWPRGHRKAIPLPRAKNPQSLERLAERIRELRIDVLMIDTGSKFFAGHIEPGRGIPEEAHETIEQLRDLSGRPLTVVMMVHTRKLDQRLRNRNELEEVAGNFGNNADGILVIRQDGEDRGPRRRVTFAKVRRGPPLDDVIASFPSRDSTEPARLTLVADLGGQPVKAGTDAEVMADWIRAQDEPVAATVLEAKFGISQATLRRRRIALESLGIHHDRIRNLPGNTHGYATEEQWKQNLGIGLDDDEEATA